MHTLLKPWKSEQSKRVAGIAHARAHTHTQRGRVPGLTVPTVTWECPEIEMVAPFVHCTAAASERSAPVSSERRMNAKALAGCSLVT